MVTALVVHVDTLAFKLNIERDSVRVLQKNALSFGMPRGCVNKVAKSSEPQPTETDSQ